MGDDESIMEDEPMVEQTQSTSIIEKKLLEEQTNMIISYFFFSLVWSVGGTLDSNSRIKFDAFFKSLCDMEGPTAKFPK